MVLLARLVGVNLADASAPIFLLSANYFKWQVYFDLVALQRRTNTWAHRRTLNHWQRSSSISVSTFLCLYLTESYLRRDWCCSRSWYHGP